MIPDAILSCSFLLLGSGVCIYRLIKYSYSQFSEPHSQFILASIGITAFGIRSIFGLIYNIFWKHYSIDPLIIEQQLMTERDEIPFSDWCLNIVGLSSTVQALYLQYNYIITGTIIVTSLILLETTIFIKDKISKYPQYQKAIVNLTSSSTKVKLVITYLKPKYLSFAWIITTELFGLMMGNDYICIAKLPYNLTKILYQPFELYQEWSIENSISDYMMLIYIIFITEALIQSS